MAATRERRWQCFSGLLMLLIAGWTPGAAHAHAVLLDTQPADGARLATPPIEVVLRFNEAVTPITVRVLDSTGRAVNAALKAMDEAVHIGLPRTLVEGGYVVSYRVTSLDSHPVAGSFTFTVGTAQPPSTPLDSVDDDVRGWRSAVVANRLVFYLALFTATGGTLFITLVAGRGSPLYSALRRGLIIATAVAMASALLGVGLQGGLLSAGRADTVLELATWRIGFASTLGHSALLTAFGLGLMGAALARERYSGTVAMLGAVIALGALATTGHAATADPRWLTAPALALHALVAAFWFGSLWPLGLAFRRLPVPQAVTVVRRFARVAIGAVVVLLMAGFLMALVQTSGRLEALTSTPYGRLLSLKLACVALLLTLAFYNNRRLTPLLAAGVDGTNRRLTRSIRTEIVAMTIVLSITALLGQTRPPRALQTHDQPRPSHPGVSPGHTVSARERGYGLSARITPAAVGRNTIELGFTRADGQPFAPLEVTVEWSLPAAGIEPLRRKAAPLGAGRFQLPDEAVPLPGMWQMRVDALVSDFEKITFGVEVPIH